MNDQCLSTAFSAQRGFGHLVRIDKLLPVRQVSFSVRGALLENAFHIVLTKKRELLQSLPSCVVQQEALGHRHSHWPRARQEKSEKTRLHVLPTFQLKSFSCFCFFLKTCAEASADSFIELWHPSALLEPNTNHPSGMGSRVPAAGEDQVEL